MKIFITGSRGLLGSYLIPLLSANKNYELIYPSKRNFRVEDEDSWRIQMDYYKPDVIVHLAAKTDVDWCEKNPEDTFRNNALPSKFISKYAPKNCKIVYMSASSVFGDYGRQIPEEDCINYSPLSQYSSSKLYGEMFLRWRNDRYHLTIVRAGWIYGGGRRDKKFLGKIYKELLLGRGVSAVSDMKGHPTYALSLAEFLCEVINQLDKKLNSKYSVLHFASIDEASRLEMALLLRSKLGSKSEIRECSNASFKLPARRPERELLGAILTSEFLDYKIPNWKDQLTRYVEEELTQHST